MRFMMLMIPKGYESAEAGTLPEDVARVDAMMAFNRRLAESGALVAADGLYPPADGARVSFATGKPVVTDGPYAETKEVVGGYWLIDVPTLADAVEWARQCPASTDETIEIRRVMETEELSPDVQAVVDGWTEMQRRKR